MNRRKRRQPKGIIERCISGFTPRLRSIPNLRPLVTLNVGGARVKRRCAWQEQPVDSLVAARLQMLMSLAFHMVYAAIGIGLPLLLVIVEALYLRTGQPHFKAQAKTSAKATGLLFAVGAVPGTALSVELGLPWPK